MNSFQILFLTVALSGAAGGLANHLILPLAANETRNISRLVRFIFAGAIVAFTVPLVLSLAQSSLTKTILEHKSGQGNLEYAYVELLILAGLCIIAAFASRRFMETLTDRVLDQVQQADKRARKAQQTAVGADKKAEEAVEKAELSEEGVDRVMEAQAVERIGRPSGKQQVVLPITTIEEVPISTIEEVQQTLTDEEKAILRAAGHYTTRTLTGVARDAHVPRSEVGEIIDRLVEKGAISYTTSANTGGPRVQLTPLGTTVLNTTLRGSQEIEKEFPHLTTTQKSE